MERAEPKPHQADRTGPELSPRDVMRAGRINLGPARSFVSSRRRRWRRLRPLVVSRPFGQLSARQPDITMSSNGPCLRCLWPSHCGSLLIVSSLLRRSRAKCTGLAHKWHKMLHKLPFCSTGGQPPFRAQPIMDGTGRPAGRAPWCRCCCAGVLLRHCEPRRLARRSRPKR